MDDLPFIMLVCLLKYKLLQYFPVSIAVDKIDEMCQNVR